MGTAHADPSSTAGTGARDRSLRGFRHPTDADTVAPHRGPQCHPPIRAQTETPRTHRQPAPHRHQQPNRVPRTPAHPAPTAPPRSPKVPIQRKPHQPQLRLTRRPPPPKRHRRRRRRRRPKPAHRRPHQRPAATHPSRRPTARPRPRSPSPTPPVTTPSTVGDDGTLSFTATNTGGERSAPTTFDISLPAGVSVRSISVDGIDDLRESVLPAARHRHRASPSPSSSRWRRYRCAETGGATATIDGSGVGWMLHVEPAPAP